MIYDETTTKSVQMPALWFLNLKKRYLEPNSQIVFAKPLAY